MDATTFLQMQQEAQAQIDALNAQIATLTQQKNDLVNTNNTSITTAQAQAQGIIDNANSQATGIIATANTNAQVITDASNKAKADADDYVSTQKALIANAQNVLKQGQDQLTANQSSLTQSQNDFASLKASIIKELSDSIVAAKSSLDAIIEKISV